MHLILINYLNLSNRYGRYVFNKLNDDQIDQMNQASIFNFNDYNKTKEKLKKYLILNETWVSLYIAQHKDQLLSLLEYG